MNEILIFFLIIISFEGHLMFLYSFYEFYGIDIAEVDQ